MLEPMRRKSSASVVIVGILFIAITSMSVATSVPVHRRKILTAVVPSVKAFQSAPMNTVQSASIVATVPTLVVM